MNSIQELTKGACKALVPTMTQSQNPLNYSKIVEYACEVSNTTRKYGTIQHRQWSHTLAEQGGWSKGCKHIHDGARRLTVVYVTTCKCTCSARKQFHT